MTGVTTTFNGILYLTVMNLTGYDHNIIGCKIIKKYFQDMYCDSLESLSDSISPCGPPDIDALCLQHPLTVESSFPWPSATGGFWGKEREGEKEQEDGQVVV